MLDVGQLAVLREVARAGSFAGAARVLGCSPQAVAQRVARLEAEAKVPLVVRGRAGVTMTPTGDALVRRAARVLAELARAEQDLHDAADEGPAVRVGSLRSAWHHTELANGFAAATGVALRPSVVDTAAGMRELLAGRLDALLGYELDLLPTRRSGRLHYVDFLHEPSWLACSPRHPAARQDVVDLRDLQDEAWLAQPTGTTLHRYLLAACRSAGFEPRLVYTSDSYDLLDPLHRNVGVTLCSGGVIPDGKVTTRPLVQRLNRTLYAAWSPAHPQAAALTVLPALARQLYLDYVQQHPPYVAWLDAHPEALPPLPVEPPSPGGPGEGGSTGQRQVREPLPTPLMP